MDIDYRDFCYFIKSLFELCVHSNLDSYGIKKTCTYRKKFSTIAVVLTLSRCFVFYTFYNFSAKLKLIIFAFKQLVQDG